MTVKREPTLLDMLLRGVGAPLDTISKGSAAPFPQVIGAEGTSWKVQDTDAAGVTPHADFGGEVMVAPFGDGPEDRMVRLHEMGHVRLTDPNVLVDMLDDPNPRSLMEWSNVAEDCRIEATLCKDPVLAEVLQAPGFKYDAGVLRNNIEAVFLDHLRSNPARALGTAKAAVDVALKMAVSRSGSHPAEGRRLLSEALAALGPDFSQYAAEVLALYDGWVERLSAEDTTTWDALQVAREMRQFSEGQGPTPNPEPQAGDGQGEGQPGEADASSPWPDDGGEPGEGEGEGEPGEPGEGSGVPGNWPSEAEFDPGTVKDWAEYERNRLSPDEMIEEVARNISQAKDLAERAEQPEEMEPRTGGFGRTAQRRVEGSGTPLGVKAQEEKWAHEASQCSPEQKAGIKWGEVKIQRPKMSVRPRKEGSLRTMHLDRGGQLRDVHRATLDGRVFRRKLKGKGKPFGAILLDLSGSMSVSSEQIERALEICPQAVIAGYSGNYDGNLVIFAEKGRMCSPQETKEALRRWGDGGNSIDLPVLEWLAKQRGPKVWVSDCHAYPAYDPGGYATYEAFMQCIRLCKREGIHIIPSFQQLLRPATERMLKELRS